jgi:lipoprotein-anchoring transpeptidase ErfK/SrfK
MAPAKKVPPAFFLALRRWHVRPTDHLLIVSISHQQVHWFHRQEGAIGDTTRGSLPGYRHLRTMRASTSRFGIGQVKESYRTPLGLHRVCRKVGGGWPIGTVFKARQPIGSIGNGYPNATIAHRILWLEGLETGFNRGGEVDTRDRFIYIHGLADEPTLGRPASRGCVHLAAADLMPLYNKVPVGTLVWIQAQ